MPIRAALCAVLFLSVTGPSLAAKQPTAKELLRQQAEHDCYGDAQRLCPNAMPDATKVQACMTSKRAQLGPACGKVFDAADKL